MGSNDTPEKRALPLLKRGVVTLRRPISHGGGVALNGHSLSTPSNQHERVGSSQALAPLAVSMVKIRRCSIGWKPMRLKLRHRMNKYKVLEEWGAGAFGVTCLVEELEGGRKFAVKKVECIDEREGNLALKEAMSLLELQHPHVCSYREFFMIWDPKVSSLFFCLVMDYCDGGNLERMVQENRRQRKIINEKIIQRFLGQAIDALIYVHKQRGSHRNLKPRNILIKEENVFILSDFVPQTLATDEMRMKIRVDPEYKIYMAPESLELQYTDKSDIWSLGCILLDLMTTSMKMDAEVSTLLEMIKMDPWCLHQNLEEIQGKVGYSEELRQLLTKMLKIHPEERPCANDVLREPYIIKCLALVGSPLSGVKMTLPPDVLDEFKDGGIDKVIGLMQRYLDYEEAQLSALMHLANYNGPLDVGDTIHLVSLSMRTHTDSSAVQWEGSQVLQSLISQALEREDYENLSTDDLISTLVEATRGYPQNAELMSAVLSVMMMISVSESAAEALRRTGFLSDLVTIMESSLEDRDLCQSCCALIWSLAMTENQIEGDCLKKAVPVICTVLRKYLDDGPLVESACTALWTLGMKGHIMAEQSESLTLLLLEALQAHSQRPLLSKNVCLALTGLVVTSELSVFRVLVPVAGVSGLSLITKLYRLHADDPEIAENVCLLLSEVAHYGSAHPELVLQHVDQLIGEIKERHDGLEEITTLADTALSRLRNTWN
ncbi:serine/threonine kinase-like domain-containing protein STKLD1 isoform X2 [Phyllobates terribilis]|uniref:serine/threonine kinase-like domain-containing protein STKLD1 isoform X2 n=1 Tax=Phyllobates terribilis TaxID=111132 RepID=UPI003CCAA3A5